MDPFHLIYLGTGLVGGYCIRILHTRYRDARDAGMTRMQAIRALVGGGGGPHEPH